MVVLVVVVVVVIVREAAVISVLQQQWQGSQSPQSSYQSQSQIWEGENSSRRFKCVCRCTCSRCSSSRGCFSRAARTELSCRTPVGENKILARLGPAIFDASNLKSEQQYVAISNKSLEYGKCAVTHPEQSSLFDAPAKKSSRHNASQTGKIQCEVVLRDHSKGCGGQSRRAGKIHG